MFDRNWNEFSMYRSVRIFFCLRGNYMRPGRTQTGMSLYRPPYISFHSFTWDRPEKCELIYQSHLSRSLTRHELLSYGSETVPFSCKTQTNLRPGP